MAALFLETGLSVLPTNIQVGITHQLSRIVGTIWHKMNRGTVHRVRHHLQTLFDYEEDNTKLESMVRDQLVLTSWNALILNLLPSLHDEHLNHLLQVEGLHYLEELQEQSKKVLLLGAHYGAYGYAVAATLSARGYPIWLVGYGGSHSPPPRTSYLYNKLYWPKVQRLNQRIQMTTVIPGKRPQPELTEILEQEASVFYLLADQYFIVRPGQDPPSHLVPLHLLNRTVYLDVTGIQLAKQMNARPLTAIPVKNGDRHRVLIEPMEWASSGTVTEDIAQDLQIYLSRIEHRLLEYPALWRDLRRPDLPPRIGLAREQ